jgi:hypothetical protein
MLSITYALASGLPSFLRERRIPVIILILLAAVLALVSVSFASKLVNPTRRR